MFNHLLQSILKFHWLKKGLDDNDYILVPLWYFGVLFMKTVYNI